jgi:hypothetical protein
MQATSPMRTTYQPKTLTSPSVSTKLCITSCHTRAYSSTMDLSRQTHPPKCDQALAGVSSCPTMPSPPVPLVLGANRVSGCATHCFWFWSRRARHPRRLCNALSDLPIDLGYNPCALYQHDRLCKHACPIARRRLDIATVYQ